MEISIKSKRLKLEKFTKDKVNKKYKSWMNDNEINKYLVKSKINNINSLKIFVESLNNSENFFFRIIHLSSGNHIGNLRVGPLSFKNKTSRFGLMIGDKKYHRLGYGKEATKLAENFIFNFLKFKKMEFECITENIAAMNIYRSLNFNEKKIKKKLNINGNTFNQVIFYKHKI